MSISRSPVLGATVDIRVDNAPPGGVAFLAIGLNQAAVDMAPYQAPGCTSLTSLDDVRMLTVDATGHAASTFRIPLSGSFAGTRLWFQAFVPDASANALGLATSAGAEMVMGVEPQLQVRTFAPTTTSPTGVIEIRGQAFSGDPRAFCLRAFDTVHNDQVLLIGESLATVAGEQVLRARVASLGPRFVSGQLMMMRGVTRSATPRAIGRLSAPAALWAVDGVDLPENNAMLGVLTIDRPEAVSTNHTYDWTWVGNSSGNQMELRFPLADPCTNAAIWPILTRITTNADVRIRVSGPNPPADTWYDTEFRAVTVQASNTNGLNVALDHAAQLRDLYQARYGPVPFSIAGMICPDDATRCCIRITPNAGYEIVGTGTRFGAMSVDCPERTDVFMLTGGFSFPGVLSTVDNVASTTQLASVGVPAIAVASSPGGDIGIVLDFDIINSSSQRLHFTRADGGASLGTTLLGPLWATSIDTSARGYVLVAGGGQLVTSVDIQTHAVVSSVQLSSTADRIVCSPNGRFALAHSAGNRDVHLIEIDAAGALLSRTSLLSGAISNPGVGAVAFNPAWSRACAANLDGSITEFVVDVNNSNTWVFSFAGTRQLVNGTGKRGYDLVFADHGTRGYLVAADVVPTQGWHLLELTMDEFGGAFVSDTLVNTYSSEPLPPMPIFKQIVVSDLGRKLFVQNGAVVRVFDIDNVLPTELAATPMQNTIMGIARRLR